MKIKITLPFVVILAIIFMILKLTGVIAWSWLWVFSPVWIFLLLGGLVMVIGMSVLKWLWKNI